MGYVVALRYKAKAGGYAGVITWTQFTSGEAFDKWFSSQDEHEIVERGITEARALELADSTPTKCLLMAAVEDHCNKQTGEPYPDRLMAEIRHILSEAQKREAA
ncbi:hypothetical protein KKD81_00495 [Patescibacteria group bacterium]|nr:hypothetical protein [Patescibacteria group bacterium]MBU2220398.1 hypothetical protein [Patescibacteria group bacterium]